MITAVSIVAFLILAPAVCCLLTGIDRIVTARMQSRIGPPLLQPFYDVMKLCEKENLNVNDYHPTFYLICHLVFMIASGAMFFSGGDILLCVFAFTLADIFLVLAAFSTNSPYSYIGAERELIQMMAADPVLLLACVGFYMATGSFNVKDIALTDNNLLIFLPGVLLGLLFVFTIKLRKSPFDLSTSHHAHQELVKGLTTDFAGPSLAIVEIAHWYSTAIILGMVFLFIPGPWYLAAAVTFVLYFIEVLVDNTCARFKWELALKSSWLFTAIFAGINLIVLFYVINHRIF